MERERERGGGEAWGKAISNSYNDFYVRGRFLINYGINNVMRFNATAGRKSFDNHWVTNGVYSLAVSHCCNW